jgi:type I restriction enzyme S subunit
VSSEISLGELCEIDVGPAFASRSFSTEPTGPRLLRGDNVAQGRLRWEGTKYWPSDLTSGYEKYALREDEVVLAMDRPWIEAGLKQAVVRSSDLPALLVQRVARLKARPGVEQRFLRWLVADLRFTAYIRAVSTGSTVPHISQSQIADYPVVRLPDVTEQLSIAEVLGALDDKIESNRQVLGLTAGLARAESDHWRYSVAAWRRTTFGEFTQVFGGATPRTTVDEYWGGRHAWATPSDITALESPYLFRTSRNITDAGLASCPADMHPPGTLFVTSRATIGAFAVPQVPCATNQGFIVVQPREKEHRWFLLDEMQRRVPDMLDRANGSTFLELSRGNFKQMELDVPVDSAAFAKLDSTLDALHKRAARAASESDTLAQLRDALLPELLSGRLRVAEELMETAT